MLRYSVILDKDNFEMKEMEWFERYLDPNLSFVSGVTSSHNHVEKHNKLAVSNNITNLNGIVSVETTNVLREGYIIVNGKFYDVLSATTFDYSSNDDGDKIEYKYLFINGKYYYEKDGNFIIDHWLVDSESGVIESSITVTDVANICNIDTVYWIENGTVSIDGNIYFFDKNRNGLSYHANGEILEDSAITRCSSITYHPYDSTALYEEVTKFRLIKDDESSIPFERATHCKYFSYVMYKNHYCPITQVFIGDDYSFKCGIPIYVLSGTSITDESMETVQFDVYYTPETDNQIDLENKIAISGNNVDIHGVYEMSDLNNVISYIIVDENIFFVSNEIQNSNDGKMLAVYLEGGTDGIAVGETVRLVNTSDVASYLNVYSGLTNGEGDFVIFKNSKYYVEDKICDKALIGGAECDIEYMSSMNDNDNCLVKINGENVPFKIISGGTKLYRYGSIVSGVSSWTTSVEYPIVHYSGVTIEGNKYIVNDDRGYRYIEGIGLNTEYIFTVEDIVGSSLLVCKPSFEPTNFTKGFITQVSHEICDDVVRNQSSFMLYTKNKIFGDREITKELAFTNTESPKSSDDYYNVLENLVVYKRSGYINVPLKLGSTIGGNPLQDDTVENQFFKKERNNAINPIIDMEKDVYYPKFISNKTGADKHKYRGADTDFKPIVKINLNLHFRTRNTNNDNWKVNEEYNGFDAEMCNWFITDYHPYVNLLNLEWQGSDNWEVMQESSDLVGLLFFTNYDVYYQKDKLAKSFLRLSYYDSTDEQNQQLLAMSTVFFDEHATYKKYIDNSRKNVNDYGVVDSSNDLVKTSKISVFTEFLGKKESSRVDDYSPSDVDMEMFAEDSHRISSRFVVKNKYETDTSSEGFYVYMFREYSQKLMPKAIYMKVEFNHAGVGKTIPFSIPMHWSGSSNVSGETYPQTALTLNSDEIKKGYPLSFVHAQSYIPLYAVYDFKNKEYAYVFDDRYFINSSKEKIYNDGVVNLNLFEMKVKNETTYDDREKEAMSKRQQLKAVIDINTNQFEIENPICR